MADGSRDKFWRPVLTALGALGCALGLAIAPTVPPLAGAVGCVPVRPPLDAASTPLANGDMLWVSGSGTVGITTPGGTGTVQVANAGPLPLEAFVLDAQQDGQRQLIVSNGRVAHLFSIAACDITPIIGPDGQPFLFDMQNLRGNGTGVGCVDFGDGRRLAGLQALPQGSGWQVRRTEINLAGTNATIGTSDTVTAASAQSPMVTEAQTITCGDRTISQDGVQQP
jgi:hypothetical protein